MCVCVCVLMLMCPGYYIKLRVMVLLHSWSMKNMEYPFVAIALTCPVGCGYRIQRLHLCREVRPPLMSVRDMTLNHLMVRLQRFWNFGE